MDKETQAAVTDHLIEEIMASREEADTKAKIVPVHVLNDVSGTMAKITREVRHKQGGQRTSCRVFANTPYS